MPSTKLIVAITILWAMLLTSAYKVRRHHEKTTPQRGVANLMHAACMVTKPKDKIFVAGFNCTRQKYALSLQHFYSLSVIRRYDNPVLFNLWRQMKNDCLLGVLACDTDDNNNEVFIFANPEPTYLLSSFYTDRKSWNSFYQHALPNLPFDSIIAPSCSLEQFANKKIINEPVLVSGAGTLWYVCTKEKSNDAE